MALQQIQKRSLLLRFDPTTGQEVMDIIAKMRNSAPAAGHDEIFLSLVVLVIDIYNLKITGDWSHFEGPQGRQSSSPALSLRCQHNPFQIIYLMYNRILQDLNTHVSITIQTVINGKQLFEILPHM